MEKTQLDFNAPLLSVRRFSSPIRRDPKAISENTLPNKQHNLLDQVTEPVAVPFIWEHIPGRVKSKSGPQPQTRPFKESSFSPSFPPGKNVRDNKSHPSKKDIKDQIVPRIQTQTTFFNRDLTKMESSKEHVNKNNDDDAFSDALDILSQASFSINYSVSGLSGSDGLDVKPSGTFSTDPETRDFMMRRFLPAAKAMTLETPHYTSKKQSSAIVVHEQPREVKKLVKEHTKVPLKNYELMNTPYFEQARDEEEKRYNCYAIAPAKSSFGFLPLLKKTLRLFNPVPAMKHSTGSPNMSTSKISRQKKSYSGPISPNIDKHALDAMLSKHKFENGAKNMQNRNSIHANYSGELQTKSWSSPYRNSRSGGISPYRNEAPISPLHRATGFLGIPKDFKYLKPNVVDMENSQRVLSQQKNERRLRSLSPAVEKTVYVDSVNADRDLKSHLNSSDVNARINSATKKVEVLTAKVDQESRSIVRSNIDFDQNVKTIHPPLPKSPSESWLCRTLPTVPSRNTSPVSKRKLVPITSATCIKWENIVKTSYLHHDRVRYSEELVANVRKQFKT